MTNIFKDGNRDFKEYFDEIKKTKIFVRDLPTYSAILFKKTFYNQDFPIWRLNLLWEYIWDDISYEEMERIFISKKVL